MPANGAIYIQHNNVNLYDVFDNVSSDKGWFKKPSYYDVTLGEDVVRFNIMPKDEVPKHINGFLGYIDSLDQDQERKDDTARGVRNTQVVLGLVTDKEFDENHAIWESLFKIADKHHGLVFVHNSVLLPNGVVLVGPLLEQDA